MRATWLADVLRGAGLDVVEQPGWLAHGRDLDDIAGVMWHHTASPVSSTLQTNLNVVTNGNSVAPGPIAQALVWRTGTWHIIAAGRANHAGKGTLPWIGTDRANARLLGIECVNNGVGETWSPAMVVSLEIGTAAILRHLGLDADRVTTHWEYAPTRKIDPAGPNGGRIAYAPGTRMTWSPDAVRASVARWLAPAPTPQPPTEEDDEMVLLHLVSPTKGEWLWTPGGEPQPFKSMSDYAAIVGGIKSATGREPQRVNVSDAQLVALQSERPA